MITQGQESSEHTHNGATSRTDLLHKNPQTSKIIQRIANRLKIEDEQLRMQTAQEINELALLLIDLRQIL